MRQSIGKMTGKVLKFHSKRGRGEYMIIENSITESYYDGSIPTSKIRRMAIDVTLLNKEILKLGIKDGSDVELEFNSHHVGMMFCNKFFHTMSHEAQSISLLKEKKKNVFFSDTLEQEEINPIHETQYGSCGKCYSQEYEECPCNPHFMLEDHAGEKIYPVEQLDQCDDPPIEKINPCKSDESDLPF